MPSRPNTTYCNPTQSVIMLAMSHFSISCSDELFSLFQMLIFMSDQTSSNLEYGGNCLKLEELSTQLMYTGR